MKLYRITALTLLLVITWSGLQAQKTNDILEMLQKSMHANQARSSGTQDKKYQQARAFEKAGLWEEAEQLYREINLEEPGVSKYFSPLKSILGQRKDWPELIKFYQLYLQARPDDFNARIDLGGTYILADSTQRWQALFQQIADENISSETVYKRIINKLMSLSEDDFARKILQQYRRANNDPGFYAYNMGNLFALRMNYKQALDEYLLFLSLQPEKIQSVSDKILTFPETPDIQILIKDRLSASGLQSAKLILSDVAFKEKAYPKAFDILKNANAAPVRFLELGKDLLSVKAYTLADSVLHYVLSADSSEDVLEQTVYVLAKLYEQQTIQTRNVLPISGFYRGNPFFTSPFLRVDEGSSEALMEAVAIYDSLRTNKASAEAAFRLGEIRFLILFDLDGAQLNYSEVLKMPGKLPFLPPTKLRLVDLLIAKGNLSAAGALASDYLSTASRPPFVFALKQKIAQILMYQNNLDSLNVLITGMVREMDPSDALYNDVLEVSGLLKTFGSDTTAFTVFAEAQFLLQQNKRAEAIKRLEPLSHSSTPEIGQLATYQLATLYLLQGESDKAGQITLTMDGESLYAELGMIMRAEIKDYLENDLAAAIDIYLEFLDKYPLSIYYDDVRIRLRELAS
ncbi:MAG: hypothetical protein GXO91_01380 [FCB group bacterium]|nr:hypothetical protein [FCB group bacterium]